MSPTLSVVAESPPAPALKPETVAQRVRRLQAEAKEAARVHVLTLTAAMAQVELIAADIAKGGESYQVGVRNMARLLTEQMASQVETLTAILARSK
jgi:hypothetical protein